MTTSRHPIQFVIRYAQVAYCGYMLIDSSDPEIRAALRTENSFRIHSKPDSCLAKLVGCKTSASIHAGAGYPRRPKLCWVAARSHRTNFGSSLRPHSHRGTIKEERRIFVVHMRRRCILSKSIGSVLIETILFRSEICATHMNSESAPAVKRPVLIGVRNASFLLKSIIGNVSVQGSADVHGYYSRPRLPVPNFCARSLSFQTYQEKVWFRT